MSIEVTVKKWGNSMGIILPKEFIEERNIKEGEKVSIQVMKTLDLRTIPKLNIKENTQKIKNEMKRGWD